MSRRDKTRPRIGWLAQTRNLSTASVRYRCFHMAWALQRRGVDSVINTKPEPLIEDLPQLDAVVLVKRLDRAVEQVARAAHAQGLPLFLDLCDDLLSPAQGPKRSNLHREVFAIIAPWLTAVVTTNQAFAEHIAGYGFPMPRVVVIPDLAETREIFEAVNQAAMTIPDRAADATSVRTDSPPSSQPPVPKSSKLSRRLLDLLSKGRRTSSSDAIRRVVWFGNHGAPHSNFGILSLLSAASALRTAAERFPIELVVLSNHQAKYEAFIPKIGVRSRYVSWTPEAVYAELAQADVALLTNGDDEFSAVKSANRPLQALACGVPVVTSGNRASRALGDAVVVDDFTAGLLGYLGDRRRAETAVRKSRELIDRAFSPQALADAWKTLITLGPAPLGPGDAPSRPPPGRLFLIDTPTAPPAVIARIRTTRARGEIAMVLVTPAAGSAAVVEVLVAEGLTPVMASVDDLEAGDPRWLRSAIEVLMTEETGASPAGLALEALAAAHNTPVARL